MSRFLTTTALVICSATALTAQGYDRDARVAELLQRQADEDLTFGIGGTTIEIYGYVKLDLVRDFGYELGNTTFGLVGLNNATPTGDFTNETLAQTRLGFRTWTPTDFGDFTTNLEYDLYGDGRDFSTGENYEERPRIAKVGLGPFSLGKDWTTFMPLSSYPVTLDFLGVGGIPFARRPQLRYTQDIMGDYVLDLAIEESDNDLVDSPVYVAALAYDTDPLLLRGSLLAGETENAVGQTDDAYGVNLSTTAQLWSGATLDAAVTFGQGIASYLVFGGNDLDANGHAIENRSAYIGLSQTVGDKLTLRAIYGYRHDNTSAPVAGTDAETLTTLHLNAQYEFVPNATVGIEYFHGTKDDFAGDEFDVDRVQASLQYTF